MVRGSKSRTVVSVTPFGAKTDVKLRSSTFNGRQKHRKTLKESQKKIVLPLKKSKSKRKTSTARVRKHRAKLDVCAKTAVQCIQTFNKKMCSESDVEALRIEARKHGARPSSHMFDFSLGEKVQVCLGPGKWFLSHIYALRDCAATNALMKPYRLKGGKLRMAQYVVVQQPLDLIKDRRRNGFLAVRLAVHPSPVLQKASQVLLTEQGKAERLGQ